MKLTLADLELARLPGAALGRLATLRCEPGVEVALQDRELWVRWPVGDDDVARALLPLAGCRLYGRRHGRWHAWGHALPAFDVPASLRFQPLSQVIFPAPVQPQPASQLDIVPASLTLAPDHVLRPTVAMQCRLARFLEWAESMPACALSRFQGVVQGDRLFVLGKQLPWFERAARYWGRSVFIPVGFCPRPTLADADLRRALGVADSDLAVLGFDQVDLIAKDRFAFLTHAALRLALRERSA